MIRFLLHLALPLALLHFAFDRLPEAFAAKPRLVPAAKTKFKNAQAEVDKEDEEDEEDKDLTEDLPEDTVEGTLETDEDKLSEEEENEETEGITKDIIEESEEPEPEFPYPGATEEGFDPGTKTVRLEAQETPSELIRPIRITASGEYFYGFESSRKESSASMRLGFFSPPPKIVNKTNNKTFEDIYGSAAIPTLVGDYQWSLTQAFGDFGIKFGSGLFVSTGDGEFASASTDRAGRVPDEKYSFIMFPNMLSAIYRFQYAEKQLFVPYVEGGAGYFTFMEIRDDGEFPKLGAAPVATAAGGLNFLLDWVDPSSVRQLDVEWGINHVWLMAEFRLIQGLHKTYDFSATLVNAGVMMEF